MLKIKTQDRDILECHIGCESIPGSTDWTDKTIKCHAVVVESDFSGAVFSGMWVEAGASLVFQSTDLSDSKWRGAHTRGIRFQNVDLRGSDISIKQLALAEVDPDCHLPQGITHRSVMQAREKLYTFLHAPARAAAAPNP